MLTKDLLRYKIKAKNIQPSFLDASNPEVMAATNKLVTTVQSVIGATQQDLHTKIQETFVDSNKAISGLFKIVLKQCEFTEQKNQPTRWQWLQIGEELRKEQFFATKEAFQEALAQRCQYSGYNTISDNIYSDLPEQRILNALTLTDSTQIIQRYNCALVQGILLHSHNVVVTIAKLPPTQLRPLFRALKFHQLLAHTIEPKDQLILDLGGPLSMFTSNRSYANKLANFIPHIFGLPAWQIRADIQLKGKMLQLALDEKSKLQSHYRSLRIYIPEEYQTLLTAIKEKAPQWQISIGESFLNLGKQQYCIPDFTLKSKVDNTILYLELFHRWHYNALIKRLCEAGNSDNKSLIIGICSSLVAKKELKLRLHQIPFFHSNCFTFRQFPLFNNIKKMLYNAQNSLKKTITTT